MAFLAIIVGLALLVWSADRFIDGASHTAKHFGLPPLLIGMVIIGFGTSAPEMIVSAMAALQNNPGIALGNAYGSNIVNISLIVGISALISPMVVHSSVIKKELPILILVTLFSLWQIKDGHISRVDALILLGVFTSLMGWTIWQSFQNKEDAMATQVDQELEVQTMTISRAMLWLFVGLIVLIASSRLLVWGAVEVAHSLGISDLMIGLTIVAIGTSLPELASSVMAARKNEHDLALGNILGSNLFNTLAVVGIAGVITPIQVPGNVLYRDGLSMLALTLVVLFFAAWGRIKKINRLEGGVLVLGYLTYIVVLVWPYLGL